MRDIVHNLDPFCARCFKTPLDRIRPTPRSTLADQQHHEVITKEQHDTVRILSTVLTTTFAMDFFKRQAADFSMPTDPAYYAFSVQGQLRAITLSLMLVATAIVASRVYIRAVMLRVFRLDDFFMVAAMVRTRSCLFLRGHDSHDRNSYAVFLAVASSFMSST